MKKCKILSRFAGIIGIALILSGCGGGGSAPNNGSVDAFKGNWTYYTASTSQTTAITISSTGAITGNVTPGIGYWNNLIPGQITGGVDSNGNTDFTIYYPGYTGGTSSYHVTGTLTVTGNTLTGNLKETWTGGYSSWNPVFNKTQ